MPTSASRRCWRTRLEVASGECLEDRERLFLAFSGARQAGLFPGLHPLAVASSRGLLGFFFDDDGCFTEGHRVPLIDAGVVKTPFTGRRVLARYQLLHTELAHAAYDGVPSLAVPKLCPAPGRKSLPELLGGSPGILVSLVAGGEFTSDGIYTTPVQLAFLHDGERLLGKLPELVLRGQDRNMFGAGYRGVSTETWPRLSGEHLMVLEMDVTRE
jgi:PmbA protein